MTTPAYEAQLEKAADLLQVFAIGAALDQFGTQLVSQSQSQLDAVDTASKAVQGAMGTSLIASGSARADRELSMLRQGVAKHSQELTTLGSVIAAHGQRRLVYENTAAQLRAQLAELVADKPPTTTVHDPITTALTASYSQAASVMLTKAQAVRDDIDNEEARTATELTALAEGGVARLLSDPTAYGHHRAVVGHVQPAAPAHHAKPAPHHPTSSTGSGGAAIAPAGGADHKGTSGHNTTNGDGGVGIPAAHKPSHPQHHAAPKGGDGGAAVLPPAAKVVGPVIKGKTSWFGGPDDPSNTGATASGIPESHPGIAVYDEKTLGGYWRVRFPNGKVLVLQQTDIGPAPWTGRKVDVIYSALPAAGYSESNFPTGSTVTASFLGFKAPPGAI